MIDLIHSPPSTLNCLVLRVFQFSSVQFVVTIDYRLMEYSNHDLLYLNKLYSMYIPFFTYFTLLLLVSSYLFIYKVLKL